MRNIIILGSTGSIGTQALEIIRENPDKFNIAGLTCNKNTEKLLTQIDEFQPESVCVGREEDAEKIHSRHPNLAVYYGNKGLKEIVKMDADMVLNALMGISGLEPTYEAIKEGKDIALANKETLVAGGRLITDLVKKENVKLLPVDSEHSAIFQCLQGSGNNKIKKILLTASGGPFRNYTSEQLKNVTLEQALNHPKWNMGRKITIDSATMMNKGLEVIEAKWLFGVEPDMIQILVHPQSIVHSMVEFEDTSVIAQLGLPDMRIPIGLAFNYPDRLKYNGESLDFFKQGADLHFEKLDTNVFKCSELAYTALREGGNSCTVLNGANEALVAMFLVGKIKFTDIQNTLTKVMEKNVCRKVSSVEEILEIDREARAAAVHIVQEGLC